VTRLHKTIDLGFKSLLGQVIQLLSKMSRLALRPIEPPIQWVLWAPFLAVNWAGY